MNLYLRLIWLLISWRLRSQAAITDEISTPFRVLPNDLDIFRHMTNSRYLALMDLARMDLIYRSGYSRILGERGWYPVAAAETIRFKKSLELWDAFEIRTKVVGWDERSFFLEQRFVRGETLMALALVHVRFLSKKGGTLATAELLQAGGVAVRVEELPGFVKEWRASVEEQWAEATKG